MHTILGLNEAGRESEVGLCPLLKGIYSGGRIAEAAQLILDVEEEFLGAKTRYDFVCGMWPFPFNRSVTVFKFISGFFYSLTHRKLFLEYLDSLKKL